MAGYNRVVMVGNLTRDPEYKQLTSGQSVCRLGLATNRQFKNRQTGSMVQEVCYVDIDVWGPQAESCRQYLSKGRSILVEGRLKLDSWEDQNGQTRNKHSIVADRVVFLSASNEAELGNNEKASADQQRVQGAQAAAGGQLEKELLDQIDQIKSRTQAAKPKPKAAAAQKASQPGQQAAPTGGEINFKDEPPFQDDLPF